jgi:hypothetical protein
MTKEALLKALDGAVVGFDVRLGKVLEDVALEMAPDRGSVPVDGEEAIQPALSAGVGEFMQGDGKALLRDLKREADFHDTQAAQLRSQIADGSMPTALGGQLARATQEKHGNLTRRIATALACLADIAVEDAERHTRVTVRNMPAVNPLAGLPPRPTRPVVELAPADDERRPRSKVPTVRRMRAVRIEQ